MPDINVPAVIPASRQPRGGVKINGVAMPWTEWSVDNNAYRAADTFSVTLPVGLLPAANGMAWFGAQTSLQCEVFVNANPADPDNYQPAINDRLILGQVDDLNFDPIGGTLAMTGRDLTAKFIDTKTDEAYLNKTSSQIATLLAARLGFTPVVTATTTQVGQFYSQNHISLTQERSEWDILVQLAEFENFDVFVTGNELHFQPKPLDTGARYAIVWTPPSDTNASPQANATTLNFSRAMTIAKGVVVTVTSWHGKSAKAFTASWPKAVKSAKPGAADSSALQYKYTIPGLTQDQANQEAQRRYNLIVQHMVKMTGDLPGDDLLDCTKIVQVRGTGTTWDQDYFPDSVKRSMSLGEGYRMTVSGKNISADLEATDQ